MAYEDFIRALGNIDPNNVDLERLKADAQTAHLADLSIRDAAVQERDQRLTEKDAEIRRLKAEQYDLLMRQPAAKTEEPPTPGAPTPGQENDAVEVSLTDFLKKE